MDRKTHPELQRSASKQISVAMGGICVTHGVLAEGVQVEAKLAD